MSSSALKRMIMYTSAINKEIVEGMVRDEVEVKNSTISAVTERHLLNDLLPENAEASEFVIQLYLGKAVGYVMTELFQYLSSGLDWKARYSNGRKLVELGNRISKESGQRFSEGQDLDYLIDNYQSVCEKLSRDAESDAELTVEVRYIRSTIDRLNSNRDTVTYSQVYESLLNNWEQLKDYSKTYRVLTVMCSQQSFENNSKERYELAQIIKAISKDWNRN